MKVITDESDASAAIIRRHLPRERHLQLIQETHEMLEAGAVIDDVVWLITPQSAMADRRQEALAHLESFAPEMADVMRSLPSVPGLMFVLYIGPEGVIGQHWQSVLTGTGNAACHAS